MRLGVCLNAANHATLLAASSVDIVEENVQSFLAPRDPDEDAWRSRLAAAQACGKPIHAANCFLPGDLKAVGPEAQHDAIAAYAAVAFRRARQAGIQRIVFGSGAARRIPEGWDAVRATAQMIELLRRLAPLAAEQGVVLVVEPLNAAECNFITSVDEGAAIVRAVDHPGVRLLADLYHMGRMGESLEALRRNLRLIAHVHVAEVERRAPPGAGGEDFTQAMRILAAWDGVMSIEAGFTDVPQQLEPALAYLRRSQPMAALAR